MKQPCEIKENMFEHYKMNSERVKTNEDWYFDNILNYKSVLDSEKQKYLLLKYKNSPDKDEKEVAFNELIMSNQKLVVHIAKKFKMDGIALDDLIQEGNIGLIKAVEKFDISYNCMLSTYATWWIKQMIVRYIYQNKSLIKIPSDICKQMHKLYKIIDNHQKEGLLLPSIKELAKTIECSEAEIKDLFIYLRVTEVISLSRTISGKKHGTEEFFIEIQELVPDKINLNPEFEYIKKELQGMILKELRLELDDRSYDIICRRYGIGKYSSPQKLEEIAKIYGITEERIRQIQQKAQSKLRKNENLFQILQG
jgi:RNA polymerase sigma factor (sigma-70 family)